MALAACLGKGRNACRIEAGHALLMALLSAAAHSDWLLAAACRSDANRLQAAGNAAAGTARCDCPGQCVAYPAGYRREAALDCRRLIAGGCPRPAG
ncbi:hypothetical protein ABXT00_09200 [Stenotrophomonas koreensis]|uniref:hypothetical protein n=1 Tax=Stenotrophomonas koreensis TaxID=266128 RepID=UPI0033933D1A